MSNNDMVYGELNNNNEIGENGTTLSKNNIEVSKNDIELSFTDIKLSLLKKYHRSQL